MIVNLKNFIFGLDYKAFYFLHAYFYLFYIKKKGKKKNKK